MRPSKINGEFVAPISTVPLPKGPSGAWDVPSCPLGPVGTLTSPCLNQHVQSRQEEAPPPPPPGGGSPGGGGCRGAKKIGVVKKEVKKGGGRWAIGGTSART